MVISRRGLLRLAGLTSAVIALPTWWLGDWFNGRHGGVVQYEAPILRYIRVNDLKPVYRPNTFWIDMDCCRIVTLKGKSFFTADPSPEACRRRLERDYANMAEAQ